MSFWRFSSVRSLAAAPVTRCSQIPTPGATLRRFLSTSTPSEAASASTQPATSSPINSSTSSSTTLSSSTKPRLPYHVERSSFNHLPIYLEAKRGGNLKRTRLQKIHGDIMALRSDIERELGLEKGLATVNQVTRHIVIKGRYKPQLTKFLLDRNF